MTAAARQEPLTRGVHHVGLTVQELDRTRRFFVDTLGYSQIGQRPDYPAVFLSDGTTMITLWSVEDPQRAIPFDRKHIVGLHHLALTVDGTRLADLRERLAALDDVVIEFDPQPVGDGPARHMMCYIPGGIRVEFIAPAD